MKILKECPKHENWSQEVTCGECLSYLLVEEDDLIKTSRPEFDVFDYKCPVCKNANLIREVPWAVSNRVNGRPKKKVT